MRSRSFRSIAVLLTVLLLANSPVQAGPVAMREIMQVLGNFQNPPDLRIRSASQGPATSSQKSSTSPLPSQIDSSVIVSHADSVLSGVVVETNTQDPVNIVIEGDIEGTVCDCGELLAVAGGFPKWPLLFLAGIPFFFLDKDDCTTCDLVTPTPTPTPPTITQTPVPEPASLLLLGSGLAAFGARLRRRRMKAKLQRETTEEG